MKFKTLLRGKATPSSSKRSGTKDQHGVYVDEGDVASKRVNQESKERKRAGKSLTKGEQVEEEVYVEVMQQLEISTLQEESEEAEDQDEAHSREIKNDEQDKQDKSTATSPKLQGGDEDLGIMSKFSADTEEVSQSERNPTLILSLEELPPLLKTTLLEPLCVNLEQELIEAVVQGATIAEIEQLLYLGASLTNAIEAKSGKTVFHFATAANDVVLMRHLMRHKDAVHALYIRDSDDTLPIELAQPPMQAQIMEFFIHETLISARANDVSTLQSLLKTLTKGGKTSQALYIKIFHAAGAAGSLEVIDEMLCAYQLNVDAVLKTGRTALYHAIANDQLNAIKLLIERGANPDLQDIRGRKACDASSTRITQKLLKQCLLQTQARNETQVQHDFFGTSKTLVDSILVYKYGLNLDLLDQPSKAVERTGTLLNAIPQSFASQDHDVNKLQLFCREALVDFILNADEATRRAYAHKRTDSLRRFNQDKHAAPQNSSQSTVSDKSFNQMGSFVYLRRGREYSTQRKQSLVSLLHEQQASVEIPHNSEDSDGSSTDCESEAEIKNETDFEEFEETDMEDEGDEEDETRNQIQGRQHEQDQREQAQQNHAIVPTHSEVVYAKEESNKNSTFNTTTQEQAFLKEDKENVEEGNIENVANKEETVDLESEKVTKSTKDKRESVDTKIEAKNIEESSQSSQQCHSSTHQTPLQKRSDYHRINVNLFKPVFYPFVVTNDKGERSFCSIMCFAQVAPESQTCLEARCVCLLSKFPLFSIHRNILFDMFAAAMGHAEMLCSVKVSAADIAHAVVGQETNMSNQTGLRINTTTRLIAFDQPPPLSLPVVDEICFDALFTCLGAKSVGAILSALLTEQSVLLVSEHSHVLTMVSYGLLALLFPFEWVNSFIPILPFEAIQLTQAPFPFFFGIQSAYLQHISQTHLDSLVVVDVDHDTVQIPKTSSKPSITSAGPTIEREVGFSDAVVTKEIAMLPVALQQIIEHAMGEAIPPRELRPSVGDMARVIGTPGRTFAASLRSQNEDDSSKKPRSSGARGRSFKYLSLPRKNLVFDVESLAQRPQNAPMYATARMLPHEETRASSARAYNVSLVRAACIEVIVHLIGSFGRSKYDASVKEAMLQRQEPEVRAFLEVMLNTQSWSLFASQVRQNTTISEKRRSELEVFHTLMDFQLHHDRAIINAAQVLVHTECSPYAKECKTFRRGEIVTIIDRCQQDDSNNGEPLVWYRLRESPGWALVQSPNDFRILGSSVASENSKVTEQQLATEVEATRHVHAADLHYGNEKLYPQRASIQLSPPNQDIEGLDADLDHDSLFQTVNYGSFEKSFGEKSLIGRRG